MGLLVDGQWQDKWYDTEKNGGRFVRKDSQFRNWITADGSAGPTGDGGFKAEKGRYHLYVSLACPWAHRTLIVRALKGLEDFISLSVVNPQMLENGWTFEDGPGVIKDSVNNADYLFEVYKAADDNYSGRVTVPVLWDKQTGKIVNNESSEILRMLNSAFDDIGAKPGDYSPEALMDEIDAMNDRVYNNVNNGVYKSGFATKQEVYEEEVTNVFKVLDELEEHLENRKYLVGDQLTEADIRLFTTLVRFDAVYYSHFKCNFKRIVDYPNLWRLTREIYNIEGVAETVNMQHIKDHYYISHKTINPTGIVPKGPELAFSL
ncbi:glutathione S-transferase family protein [Aerococcaceae bacterium INB8]|uniref:Glutathione S-transferase family protein n=1 Tax=Ruoffia halotolerans TaxID=2748684 RepID=A0A839A534_9LACT|nr:glutathione S-transferase family protein [Ruoffia halotolerans]MBA5728715.1 glutathione S-transferase family protein [Ruoffia halotolerans]